MEQHAWGYLSITAERHQNLFQASISTTSQSHSNMLIKSSCSAFHITGQKQGCFLKQPPQHTKFPFFTSRELLAKLQTPHRDSPLKCLLSLKDSECNWKMQITRSYLSLQQLTLKNHNGILYKLFVWSLSFSTATLHYRGCIPTVMTD